VTQYALLLVVLGYVISTVAKPVKIKRYGGIALGLGMVFFAMSLMSEATCPLRSYEPFIQAMKGLDNLLLAVLIGALFTAIVQSSGATTGLVIVLATRDLSNWKPGLA